MRYACVLVLLTSIAAAQEAPPEAPKWTVPSFTDLTLKIRQIRGLMSPRAETLYLKGTRERIEQGAPLARPGFGPLFAMILQCDARTTVFLRPVNKTYRTSVEPPENQRKGHPWPVRSSDGPLVTVTIHSDDTGETRQVGGYQAHRFKTTVQIEPSKGAATKPGKVEADTWYLDIPGLNCRAEDTRPAAWAGHLYTQLLARPMSDHRDHVEINVTGAQPHGMVMEEIAKAVSGGNEMVLKTEWVQVSADPLDPSLFEIPADYRQFTPESHPGMLNREADPN